MFQQALAEIIQAEREREIAERIRQRRLLTPDPDAQDAAPAPLRTSPSPQTRAAGARAVGT
jgi:hypothetical protein